MKKKRAAMKRIKKLSKGSVKINDNLEEVMKFAGKIYAISGKMTELRKKEIGGNLKVKKTMRRRNLMQEMNHQLSSHDLSTGIEDNNGVNKIRRRKTRRIAMKVKVMMRRTVRKKEKKNHQKKTVHTHPPTTDFQAALPLILKATPVNSRKQCVISIFGTSSNRGAKTSPKDSPKNTDTVTSGTKKCTIGRSIAKKTNSG